MRINLTKKDIINSIYMQIGFSKKISENILDDIFNLLIKNIKKHKKVKISKFGTFSIRRKNSRIGRNPLTKEKHLRFLCANVNGYTKCLLHIKNRNK